jgi:hypothetical protein
LAIRTIKGSGDEPAQELARRRSEEPAPGHQKNLDYGGMSTLAAAPVDLRFWIGKDML